MEVRLHLIHLILIPTVQQWGSVSVSTNNEQGPHTASLALPLTASKFLQGAATYDFPAGACVPTSAVSCNATTVTVGAQLLPGYTGNPVIIRWVALFQ